jgi:hypothetical protein
MSKTNRKQSKLIATIAFLALMLTCLMSVAISVIHRRNVAEAFLKDATVLQLRLATVHDLQKLSLRYGGHIEPSTCDSRGCAYFFSFDNRWLHRLRLAPYTWFTCTLGTADNVLVYRRVLLTTTDNSLDFGAFVEEWASYPGDLSVLKKPFDVRLQPAGVAGDVRWRVHVNLTADATLEQHNVAYDLNLKCLSKIGSCDAQQMLPSIKWSNLPTHGATLRGVSSHN